MRKILTEKHLDNPATLQLIMQAALRLGFIHASFNEKRVNANRLIEILAQSHGQFGYRRFHQESLNRAYGIAFTCKDKLAYAKARGV